MSFNGFRQAHERALAMALVAIIAAITVAGVLIFKHHHDHHAAQSHALILPQPAPNLTARLAFRST
jgi:hypothetical protein